MDGLSHEWVALFCKDKVIADANRNCFWQYDRINQEGIKGTQASYIQV
jgi:hypothetical protein